MKTGSSPNAATQAKKRWNAGRYAVVKAYVDGWVSMGAPLPTVLGHL
jgi:hypothetical protein